MLIKCGLLAKLRQIQTRKAVGFESLIASRSVDLAMTLIVDSRDE